MPLLQHARAARRVALRTRSVTNRCRWWSGEAVRGEFLRPILDQGQLVRFAALGNSLQRYGGNRMAQLSPKRRRLLTVVVGLAALAVAAASGPAAAAPANNRHVIPGSTPQWLGQAQSLGDTPAGNRVSFGVLLKMRNSSAAVSTLASISDPASADYGKWLTSAQFRAAYAPAASDAKAVGDWLAAQGFQVGKTVGGMYVEATGSASQ